MYLVVTRVPGESYRRRLRSLLLCLCYVFRALIKSLCVLILYMRSGPRSVSDHAVPLVEESSELTKLPALAFTDR